MAHGDEEQRREARGSDRDLGTVVSHLVQRIFAALTRNGREKASRGQRARRFSVPFCAQH